MRANRYGNILTVILVILVIGILVGLGFLVYNVVKTKEIKSRVLHI